MKHLWRGFPLCKPFIESFWPSFDPEHEKSRQGWMETTENQPSEWWQKAQIGAEMTPICAWDCLITRRSEVQVLLPQPSWVTKIDTLTWNPWEIRGFSVFMPCFFKACFIDTQGHFRALGRTWTKFSADLACFMVGFTLLDTFYCSSFLNNLKLFIEEVGITFWYQPLFSLSNP